MTFALNRLIYPPERMMMFNKTGLLLATAIVVVFASAIVVIGAAPEPAAAMSAFQAQPNPVAPEKPDNTSLWTALIASIALNLINAGSSAFNAWINMKLKLSQDGMQKSLTVNNRMTAETNMAVRGQQESIEVLKEELADKSNDRKKQQP